MIQDLEWKNLISGTLFILACRKEKDKVGTIAKLISSLQTQLREYKWTRTTTQLTMTRLLYSQKQKEGLAYCKLCGNSYNIQQNITKYLSALPCQ